MAELEGVVSTRGFGDSTLIFITVGTTIPFDELLAEVDRLAANGVIKEQIICQGGQSSYRISSGEQFVGRPNIQEFYDASSLVICHGGAGTVLELLRAEKPFVAFPNPRAAGDHQTSFLRQISSIVDISWSQDVAQLERLIADRNRRGAARIDVNIPKAAVVIRSCLNS